MNLDAMTSDDLVKLYNSIHSSPVKMARELFPQSPKGFVRSTKDIGHYAINKAVAIDCRTNGDIESARKYEAICDSIYSSLPDYAKTW